MDKSAGRPIPLQLVTFAILSPSNTPLYIHSYTGKQDELRYVQIAHSALDIVEEKGKFLACDSYMLLFLCFPGNAYPIFGRIDVGQ